MDKFIYVTFQVVPDDKKMFGTERIKYAVQCPTLEVAQEVASTFREWKSVHYVRINQSNRLKGVPFIIKAGTDYASEIDKTFDQMKESLTDKCLNCIKWCGRKADKEAKCDKHNIVTSRTQTCHWHSRRPKGFRVLKKVQGGVPARVHRPQLKK